MERITERQLQALVDHLNKITNSPPTPWTRDDKGFRANIGNYHLSHAYGGVCLHRMHNDGGGVTTPLVYGHVPKRELYNALRAYLTGLEQRNEVEA